jgi:hypothetical protein
MRCLTCHYDLRNLKSVGEHRCPECGSAFDPDDPGSFESAWFKSRVKTRILIIGLWIVSMTMVVIEVRLGMKPVHVVLSTLVPCALFMAIFLRMDHKHVGP